MKLRRINIKINEKFKPKKITVSIISHSGTDPLNFKIFSLGQYRFMNESIGFAFY